MSTCGEPCDGCPNRAEHHLCDACCHDEVDAIQKENRELRAEVERLKALLGRRDPVQCASCGHVRERVEWAACGHCTMPMDGGEAP